MFVLKHLPQLGFKKLRLVNNAKKVYNIKTRTKKTRKDFCHRQNA